MQFNGSKQSICTQVSKLVFLVFKYFQFGLAYLFEYKSRSENRLRLMIITTSYKQDVPHYTNSKFFSITLKRYPSSSKCTFFVSFLFFDISRLLYFVWTAIQIQKEHHFSFIFLCTSNSNFYYFSTSFFKNIIICT